MYRRTQYLSVCIFFFQAEDGIRDLVRSRGLGDVYKRQPDRCAAGDTLTVTKLKVAHLSGVARLTHLIIYQFVLLIDKSSVVSILMNGSPPRGGQ